MTKLGTKRSFTVVNAKHTDGCATKVPNNSRLISSRPDGAAKKAFSELCNRKKIKGACSLYVTVRETTQGSNHKQYTYKTVRNKLSKPLNLKGRVVEYTITAHAANKSPHCPKSRKSPGPMRKRTMRKH